MDDKENIVLIDSNETEGIDFINGLQETTNEKWNLIVKNNNDRSNKISNLIRYIRYFTFPFFIFLFRKKYNRIIAWQQFYGLFLSFFMKLFRVKKVNYLLVMTLIYKPKKHLLGKLYNFFFHYVVNNNYIDKFTCVANVECTNYSQTFNTDINKFHYVPWGLHDFSMDFQKPKKNFNIERYVFSAGRSNRDWPFLFNCFNDSLYRAKFVCNDNKFKNCSENIEVLKNISDKEYYTLLKNSYCVVLSIKDPSISAGQITLLQAMQFGKPIILTESAGLTTDYVIDGLTGIVVTKNKHSLLAAIDLLYNSPDVYEKISKNCRKLFNEKYSNFRLGEDIGRIISLKSK